MSDALSFLEGELRRLETEGLLRRPPAAAAVGPIVLCSNDYLGLARIPWATAASAASGAGASPLVSGVHAEHVEAERALAEWLGAEAATLFSSGYAANVGTVACLVGPGDMVVSDRLNHASIIDGCRLSGAAIEVVPHADVRAVAAALDAAAGRYRRALVVTESYFSMDGDGPDLEALAGICRARGAIFMVDEAHALGVFGAEGRGRCAAAGVRPDVLVGTLGKAIGLQGAFVAGSATLRTWIWNRARSLVFSTAMSPALAARVPERVAAVRRADELRTRLGGMASELRGALGLPEAVGPIIPWVVGSAGRAVELAQRLLDRGVLVRPIRPPTVPHGSARLRITPSAGLTDAEMTRAIEVLLEVRRAL